jgi:hypothetical protein
LGLVKQTMHVVWPPMVDSGGSTSRPGSAELINSLSPMSARVHTAGIVDIVASASVSALVSAAATSSILASLDGRALAFRPLLFLAFTVKDAAFSASSSANSASPAAFAESVSALYCQHFSKNDFLKKLLKSCKWQGAVIPSLLHGCDQRIKLLNVGVCVGLPSTGGEGGG